MFRKLADSMSNAFSGNSSSNDIDMLVSMGFSRDQAISALRRNNNNLERAVEDLTSQTNTTNIAMQYTANQVEDDDLQKALEASMLDQQQKPSSTAVRSAASRKAGQAALARFDNPKKTATTTTSKATLSKTHPKVQVPKTLAETPTQQVILRCAKRLQPHVNAVDTLYKALKTLQQHPNNPKYQSIDMTTNVWKNTLEPAPGAKDFLTAMQYRPWGTKLSLSHYDPAVIFLGISALEQAKESIDYRQNKNLKIFEQELQKYLSLADVSTDEAIKRSEFMKQCPSEPPQGILCNIWLGKEQKLSRKFEADDVLENVVYFLVSHGTPILEKLESGEWWLVDKHLSDPKQPLDIQGKRNHTLQAIGAWPSGQFQLIPKPITE